MPELPEVETIVRGLRKHLVGEKITQVKLTYSQLIQPMTADISQLKNDQINISK